MVFRGIISIDAAPTGLKDLGQTQFYTDTEEIPKQINPTGLKRFLESSRFPRSIRFGWETEPTGPGAEAVVFLKLTLMVRFPNRTGLIKKTRNPMIS